MKSLLRTQLLAKRNAFSHEKIRARNAAMVEHIQEWIREHKPSAVLAFASIKNEPDLLALMNRVHVFALPRVEGPGLLAFYRTTSGSELTKGTFSIPEPAASAKTLIIPDAKTLVLVPCIGISETGDRLGYGGGFYDRWLTSHPEVITMGIVDSDFIVPTLPIDPWDRKLAWCCSEHRITKYYHDPKAS